MKNTKETKRKNPAEISKAKIKQTRCPIFRAKDETIGRITQAIKGEEDIKQKVLSAQKLLNEAKDLLECEYFNEKKAVCKTCQCISNLRKRTANLIIKAEKLKTKS